MILAPITAILPSTKSKATFRYQLKKKENVRAKTCCSSSLIKDMVLKVATYRMEECTLTSQRTTQHLLLDMNNRIT